MRANRGEVRKRILLILSVRKHPMSASEFFGQGNYAKRNTVYPALKRLENQGLVYSHIEERRPGARGCLRRMYSVTGRGRWAAENTRLGSITGNSRRPALAREPRRYQPIETIDCPKFF